MIRAVIWEMCIRTTYSFAAGFKVRLRDVAPQPRYMATWERVKHGKVHFCTQMLAEMLGAFLYVYAGVGSTAALIVGDLISQPIGSLFTVGVAYAIGIMLAVTICGPTSGGHFAPSVTVSFVVFKGFPCERQSGMIFSHHLISWHTRRANFKRSYIFAQVLGAYIAALIIYVQWKDYLVIAQEVLVKKGLYDAMMFTPQGPGGIFALYVSPGTNLHRVLLNEFMTDFVLGLAISACLDPTNHFIPPSAAPWVIGITYAMAIWGYSPTSLAANTARDLGGRLMAMTIWGRQASGGPYAAIAALTNIPATLLAFFLYDTLLCSSTRTLTPQHVSFLRAHKTYHEDNALVPSGYLAGLESPHNDMTSERSFDAKPTGDTMVEFAARNV
ncbi:aquaporin-like protein [Chiua virens]|nr:aquaporin-like protein [Chiua virens]